MFLICVLLIFSEGHYSVAKLILDSNAEVNVPSGSENNIPLTLACWKGIFIFKHNLFEDDDQMSNFTESKL